MIRAQDQRPLRDSEALMIASTARGRVWWASVVARPPRATCIESVHGEMKPVAEVPLARVDDGWEVHVLPNELLLISPSDSSANPPQ
jgi:hypothetical protein